MGLEEYVRQYVKRGYELNDARSKVAQDIIKNSDGIYTKADGTSYRMLLGIARDKDCSIFFKNIAERYGQAQVNFLKQGDYPEAYRIRDFVRIPGLRIDVWAILLRFQGLRDLGLNDKTGHYRYYGSGSDLVGEIFVKNGYIQDALFYDEWGDEIKGRIGYRQFRTVKK